MFLAGWQAYGEEQLRQKLLQNYYQEEQRRRQFVNDIHQEAGRDESAPVETEASHFHDKMASVPHNAKASDPNGWWVRIDGKCRWAPETATLRLWVSEGRLGRNDLVWDAHTSRWIRSTKVQELQSQFYPFSPVWVKWKYDIFIAMSPIVVLLIGVIGANVMSATVNAGLLSAIQALSWRQTQGRITHSAVLAESERMVNGVTITRYQPDIRYVYQVAGRSHESGSIDFSASGQGRDSLDSANANQVVSRYSPGDEVTVYFDGALPTVATLDRGGEQIVGFIIALVITAGAALVLGRWWRRRNVVARLRNSAFPAFPSGLSPPPPPV